VKPAFVGHGQPGVGSDDQSARRVAPRNPRALEPLLRHARANGFPAEAVKAIGLLNDPRAVEPLVTWLLGDSASTAQTAEGLERLTGEGFGKDEARWARWWKENKARFAGATGATPAK